jgi:hypothetical protein
MIRIDADLQTDRTQSDINKIGQFFAHLFEKLRARPSTTGIAQQQNCQRLIDETLDNINGNMPSRVRRQMHYY